MKYIFKVFKKERNFYTLPNELAQTRNLTYAAKGLLIEILSRPPGWEFSQAGMVTTKPNPKQGLDKVRRIFRELERAGYLCFWIGKDVKNRFTGKRGWAASEESLSPKEFRKRLESENDLSDIHKFEIVKPK